MDAHSKQHCVKTLATIANINVECLVYWSEEGVLPLDLDADACARAAKCPYPLVNLAHLVRAPIAGKQRPPNGNAFVAALNATMLAWLVARSQLWNCRMLLGLSFADTKSLADCGPSQVVRLAEQGAHHLTPRWANHTAFWNSLTRHAATGDEQGLEATRLHGLQLLVLEKLSHPKCA